VTTPTVSVLVAVHNGQDCLTTAVDSVLAQTHQAVEVLVVDDGSTDQSWGVIQAIADRDDRVVPLRRPTASGGPAAPRNLAMAQANGHVLALLDQDDHWAPDKLERQLPCFGSPEVGVVYSDCWTSDGRRYLAPRRSDGALPEGDVTAAIIRRNVVPACTAVWRRSVSDAVGWFREELTSIDDRDYWVRAALLGVHFAVVDEPLATKNTAPGRLSDDRRRHAELAVQMWRLLAADSPDVPALADQLDRSRWVLASMLSREARGAPVRERIGLLRDAVAVNPSLRSAARVMRAHLAG
jgi:glycosyltransferase involved in cell wall biosynthesis